MRGAEQGIGDLRPYESVQVGGEEVRLFYDLKIRSREFGKALTDLAVALSEMNEQELGRERTLDLGINVDDQLVVFTISYTPQFRSILGNRNVSLKASHYHYGSSIGSGDSAS